MVLLVAISGWVLFSTLGAQVLGPQAGWGDAANIRPSASPLPSAKLPSRTQVVAPSGQYFGVSTPEAPWRPSEIDDIAELAGQRPTLLQFFVNWTDEYRPEAVEAAYQQGAVPVLSWEPWSGLADGTDQPKYSLDEIASGAHDAYITRFAVAVREQNLPVVIRFAHEMNGTWYPWAESADSNELGDYVPAWRHVHDIFRKIGATNAIWVWSPNIVRPVPKVELKPLYPGDGYVDWVGIVGYKADEETTAKETFEPTVDVIRKFTRKPIIITETGAADTADRPEWTSSLFTWIAGRRDVVGFIWFQFNKETTGTRDWRFTTDSQTTDAVRSGLSRVRLAQPVQP